MFEILLLCTLTLPHVQAQEAFMRAQTDADWTPAESEDECVGLLIRRKLDQILLDLNKQYEKLIKENTDEALEQADKIKYFKIVAINQLHLPRDENNKVDPKYLSRIASWWYTNQRWKFKLINREEEITNGKIHIQMKVERDLVKRPRNIPLPDVQEHETTDRYSNYLKWFRQEVLDWEVVLETTYYCRMRPLKEISTSRYSFELYINTKLADGSLLIYSILDRGTKKN